MAGLSAELTSLVEAADDPAAVIYAVTHLGVGVTTPKNGNDRGFPEQVRRLRQELLRKLSGFSPLRPLARLQHRQLEQILLRQREQIQLEVQERQLAEELFQGASLKLFVRKLPNDSPETLRKKLQDDSSLARLLVAHAIGYRHLHLEADLIERLKDPEPVVRQAARQALVRVARGTDFGPLPGWSRVGIERSVERWQHWLALQQADSSDALAQSTALPKAKPAPGTPAQAAAASPGLMIEKVLAPSASTLETVDSRAMAMSAELVRARDDEQAEVLTRLRDAKGVEHTDALALAISQLSGDIRDQARDALVQRLARMTAKTLRAKFDEDDVEVRRAAALACARKGAQEHIPDLLELLNDPESAVVQVARKALHDLTGRDFGPEAGAGPGEHARAVAAWYDWWRKRQADAK